MEGFFTVFGFVLCGLVYIVVGWFYGFSDGVRYCRYVAKSKLAKKASSKAGEGQ